MNPLTERIVLQKTKVDDLEAVRSLNLWGQNLDDMSILRKMPNATVLSLSVNKINSLASFADCRNLSELYLRKNEVTDLSEVKHLKPLSKLRILWLCENPCASSPSYRAQVIAALPQLEKLDNIDIKPEERALAKKAAAASSSPPQPSRPAHPNASPNSAQRAGLDRSQRNIVTAVLALLNELSPSSLELVHQDISTRLVSRQ
ncbi:cilla- and flagella-associated protein [Diplonema papillatum]|nr:cilla- and flagella-associated protein [Diplonema papillatum]